MHRHLTNFRGCLKLLAASVVGLTSVMILAPSSIARADGLSSDCSLSENEAESAFEVSNGVDLAILRTDPDCLDQPIVQTQDIPLDAVLDEDFITNGISSFSGDYNGGGYSIVYPDAGWLQTPGVFATISDATVYSLSVDSGDVALLPEKGWIAGTATDSIFGGVSSNGVISDDGGGIVGMGSVDVIVTNSSSSGPITGNNSGGIVGPYSIGAHVYDSYSTGTIGTDDHPSAGGIIGPWANISASETDPPLWVENSFAAGDIIGNSSGGIIGGSVNLGSEGSRVLVRGSFSTGAILGSYAGGIIGDNANRLAVDSTITIESSFSTGAILGSGSGGIMGALANFESVESTVEVTGVFSTGEINGAFSGGIIGSSANAVAESSNVEVDHAYSRGDISGTYAGGIIGSSANYDATYTSRGEEYAAVSVTSSYSTGSVLGSDAGGIFGDYEGTDAWGILSDSNYAVGDFEGDHTWHDFIALTEIPDAPSSPDEFRGHWWGQCAPNTPYFLTAFYALNPCSDANYRQLIVGDSGDVTPTSLNAANGRFTLVDQRSEDEPIFVSLVSHTGWVSLNGITCEYLLQCRLDSFTSSGGYAKGEGNVLADGDIYVVTVFGDGSIVWSDPISVRNVRRAERHRSSSFEVTFDPAGGTCSGHDSPWSISSRRSVPLPPASECRRDGYVFTGWSSDPESGEHELTGSTREPSLTAVWGKLPVQPTTVVVLPDFFCDRCGTALVIWQTPDIDVTGFDLSVDSAPAACTPIPFGEWWICGLSGITSGQPHEYSVVAHNAYGTGPVAVVRA